MKKQKLLLVTVTGLCTCLMSAAVLSGCQLFHKHTYTESTKEATCTEKGLITYTCESCEDTYTEEIPALGHDLEQHEGKAPTCLEAGWAEYSTCEREGCEYTTYQDLSALDHDLETHAAKAPTCVEVGWEEYVTCKRSGCEHSTYVEIPATGRHTWDEGESTKEATLTEKGEITYHCTGCTETKTESVPMLVSKLTLENPKVSIGGYEWGPAINAVIFQVEGTIAQDSLSKDVFEASTKVTDMSGNVTTEKITIIDAYPCTEKGVKTSEASGWFAIQFESKYNSLSPFTYDFASGLNSWNEEATISISLKSGNVLTIVNGSETEQYNKFSFSDPIDLSNRIVPSTDSLVKSSYKHNDITLTYAAYETEAMKNDSSKNALIIWLHGAGEGGTDVDIALLGNDVTNLTEDTVQKYFVNDTTKGAYVLAVQTPTMWMDSGTGDYTSDGESIYLEALMQTIKYYAETMNQDVDLNRIYIGGCSNGGYMTINMLINYGDYFAAAYPICEAYTDTWITDEQIKKLAGMNIWFTHSADDTTVAPATHTNATYLRLLAAGAKNVYYSYFESVKGTDDPSSTYMGHWSWVYTLQNQCTKVQSTTINSADDLKANNEGGGEYSVKIGEKEVSIWEWMAAQKKA